MIVFSVSNTGAVLCQFKDLFVINLCNLSL